MSKSIMVGFTVLIGILVLILVPVVMHLISDQKTYCLIAVFDKFANIQKDDAVNVLGFKCGKIDNVTIIDNKPAARLRIQKNVHIPVGSTFGINQAGLFKENNIDIHLSNATSFYKNGDTVLTDTIEVKGGKELGFNQTLAMTLGIMGAATNNDVSAKLDTVISLLKLQNQNINTLLMAKQKDLKK